MGRLDRLFISVIIFSLAITAGVVSQAGQQNDAATAQTRTANIAAVELVEARFHGAPKAKKAEKNLYPTTVWILGSAVLAMVGYKRMRNTATGTD